MGCTTPRRGTPSPRRINGKKRPAIPFLGTREKAGLAFAQPNPMPHQTRFPRTSQPSQRWPIKRTTTTGTFAVAQEPLFSPGKAQNCLADVGTFRASSSFCRTNDQAGNIYEWNDPQGPRSAAEPQGVPAGYLMWRMHPILMPMVFHPNTNPMAMGSGSLAKPIEEYSGAIRLSIPKSQSRTLGVWQGLASRISWRESQATTLVSTQGGRDLLGMGTNSSVDKQSMGPLAGQPHSQLIYWLAAVNFELRRLSVAQPSGMAEGWVISQMNQKNPMKGTRLMNSHHQCLPASRRRRMARGREGMISATA